MRILMLAQFYYPIPGGEERHVQDLSTELVRRGHEVAVVTLWKEGLRAFEIDSGVRIYRVKGSMQQARWLYREQQRPHVPPLPDPLITVQLREVILAERPDIVHAHNWFVYSFLPLKLWSGAKLVVTLHDYSLSCAKKRYVYQGHPCSGPGPLKCLNCASRHYGPAKGIPTVLAKNAADLFEYRLVDMFVPVSSATAEGNRLPQHKLPYKVVPNLVPPRVGSQEQPDEQYLHRLPQGDYLLFVGDLCRDKGVHILLDAYAELRDSPPLVLIGRQCIDTPPTIPEGVIVIEPLPHQAVLEAWRRSTIAITPSTWPEPFGIVVIEAMAMGRPVIASRIGGITDIVVDEVTGLLVPPEDPTALRAAMHRLLTDGELRARLGTAGRERVAMFDTSCVLPQIEQVYAEVLGQKAL